MRASALPWPAPGSPQRVSHVWWIMILLKTHPGLRPAQRSILRCQLLNRQGEEPDASLSAALSAVKDYWIDFMVPT
jgi:hypothetical protein